MGWCWTYSIKVQHVPFVFVKKSWITFSNVSSLVWQVIDLAQNVYFVFSKMEPTFWRDFMQRSKCCCFPQHVFTYIQLVSFHDSNWIRSGSFLLNFSLGFTSWLSVSSISGKMACKHYTIPKPKWIGVSKLFYRHQICCKILSNSMELKGWSFVKIAENYARHNWILKSE